MKRALIHATAIALAAGAAVTSPTLARSESMPTETTDRNKQVVRRIYEEAITTNKPELIPELVADDFDDGQGGRGPSGFRRNIDELRAGFPDIRFSVHDLVAEGDRVVVRWTWEATHAGQFKRWSATGKRVTNSGIALYQLAQGKVVRVWLENDRLGTLQQIGAIPSSVVPVPPPARR